MTTRDEQEAMDGSAATVVRTLRDLKQTGKFGSSAYGAGTLSEGRVGSDVAIEIHFQCGPIGEVGVNGCAIEDVIDVLVERLQRFQGGPFRCRENALAITKLEEAKQWLLYRTAARQAQGVEGTNQAHREEGP